MRRKDREITDIGRMLAVIDECEVCHLGFVDGESAYIVPMSFGYSSCDGKVTLYFHSARDGRKAELIKQCPKISFEMETGCKVSTGSNVCSYSMKYKSVMGTGHVTIVENVSEKIEALNAIMKHTTGKTDCEYPDGMLNSVFVFMVDADEITCKVND